MDRNRDSHISVDNHSTCRSIEERKKMIERSKHWKLVNLLQEVHGDSYTLGYLGSIFQYNVKWTDDFEERLTDLQEKSIQIQKERNR
tara:strand:+ start:893 stop:1153 length:261 start_codon:yes stop_codon:yes gene_type:complete